MGTPEASRDLHERLVRVEDAAQEFRFIHLVKTDAQTNGMGTLYAQQRRLQEELSGFRAEATAEFEAIKTEQARQGEKLASIESAVAEILRRLPE